MLLATIGSGGDVHPFIALGQALSARGHDPVVLTNPHFEPRVRDAGLDFLPLGEVEDYLRVVADPRLAAPIRGPFFIVRETAGPAAHATLDALERAIDQMHPHAVVHHHLLFGAGWACEGRAVPRATVTLAPLLWLSTHDPGVYTPLPFRPPPWLAAARLGADRLVARWCIDRRLNRVARARGHRAERDQFRLASRGGDMNLGLWSPHFRGPAPDDPPAGRICGFCWFDRTHAMPHELEVFLDDASAAGDPPIVFTLGTAAVHHPGRYFRTAVRAAQRLGRRAVLLTGDRSREPDALPADVCAVPYAPFSELLPRAGAVVHHGGIGTTAQAMRAGCPALIVPLANDEFDNAHRAARLGVSRTLARRAFRPSRLARELDALLRDVQLARSAGALADKLHAEDGANVAAGHIERLPDRLTERQPPQAGAG